MAPADPLRIEVLFSPAPRTVEARWVELPAGSLLADALEASGLLAGRGLAMECVSVAIWGRTKPLGTPLRVGDRVEICRGLQVDPKEARRLRYKRQRGASAAAAKAAVD